LGRSHQPLIFKHSLCTVLTSLIYLTQRIITPRASLPAAITPETIYHGQNLPYIMPMVNRKRSKDEQSNSHEQSNSGEQSNPCSARSNSLSLSHEAPTKLRKSVFFSISLCACAIIASVIYGLKDMVENFGEATYTILHGYTVSVSIHPYPFRAECLTLRSDRPSSYIALCRPGSRKYDRQLGRHWHHGAIVRTIAQWEYYLGSCQYLL
jgi:hypothetical protein